MTKKCPTAHSLLIFHTGIRRAGGACCKPLSKSILKDDSPGLTGWKMEPLSFRGAKLGSPLSAPDSPQGPLSSFFWTPALGTGLFSFNCGHHSVQARSKQAPPLPGVLPCPQAPEASTQTFSYSRAFLHSQRDSKVRRMGICSCFSSPFASPACVSWPRTSPNRQHN